MSVAVGAAVVALVALALALALGGTGGDDHPSAQSTATTAPPPGDHLSVVLGDVSADGVGPPATVSSEQSQQVLALVARYVKEATVAPLRSGMPVTGDLSTVFDPGALATITGADRAIALDEGLPQVTGDLEVTANPVAIVGLGDQGHVVLLTTSFVVDAHGPTRVKGVPLHIVRRADFVLAPDAAGVWKVTSYDMVVTRGGAGLDPTTTTSPPVTTKAAPTTKGKK